ncbi:MAG: tyrosine-type recombinase/integrase [Gemmatimonadaceae bacterium]|nr:tyrosine-type recombinase/integrase [Gemmatimonadaceae bacterium]
MQIQAFDARTARQLAPGDFLTMSAYPGLRLVATATTRTWTYRYRDPATGALKQMTLGRWPGVTLPQALSAWEQARGARSVGVSVGDERRAKRKEVRASAETLQRRQRSTVTRVLQQYVEEVVEPRRKTKGALEVNRMLTRAVEKFKNALAEGLTREQAHEIVLAVAKTAPRVASMTRQELRACWEHAIATGRIASANPFLGKTIGGALPGNIKRSRFLNAEETAALLQWFRQPRAYSRTVAEALELTLRTGLRSGEVVGIHTRELHERNGILWLHIPAERMKEGKAHSVPLVGRARAIAHSRTPKEGGYLFPSRDGKKPVTQKSLGVEVYAHSGASTSEVYAHLRVFPVTDWAPHDLRRTARTMLQELGCPFEIGEAILSHALPGVAANYAVSELADPKIEWLTKLNLRLDQLAEVAVAKAFAA